jgi:hypothetical protein
LAPDESDAAGEVDPDWFETAVCACSFAMRAATPYAAEAEEALDVLRAEGIPCQAVEEESTADRTALLNVMIPAALNLKASSVLDRDLFNAKLEPEWREHLEELSDRELTALRPDVICAGFLDRAARLKRVYEEEAARRKVGE